MNFLNDQFGISPVVLLMVCYPLISEKEYRDVRLDVVSSKDFRTDQFDYFVTVSLGVLCGLIDILWVGELGLARGRKLTDKEVGEFVKRVAKVLGCKDDGLKGPVAFLEKMFPLAADGNTSDFDGGCSTI